MNSPEAESNEESTVRSFQELMDRHQPTKNSVSTGSGDKSSIPPHDPPSRWLRFMMIVPWVLLAGFIVSIFWDFNNIELYVGTWSTSLEGLLRLVSISGLIGFTTNWIAIQMLFYPRKKHPVLGQGLIPAQKARIARRISLAVEQDLISSDHIKMRLSRDGHLKRMGDGLIRYVSEMADDPKFRSDLRNLMDHYIRTSLDDPEIRERIRDKAEQMIEESIAGSRLEKTAIRLYVLFKGKSLNMMLDEAISALPAKLGPALDPIDEIIDTLPDRLKTQQDRIENIFLNVLERLLDNLDVQTIVEENLNSYSEEKLEKMIRGATNTHLNYIKYLGGIIGMVGGLVIWNPLLSLILLLLNGTLIYILDYVLMTER